MKFCTNCGNKNNDKDKFCASCGQQLVRGNNTVDEKESLPSFSTFLKNKVENVTKKGVKFDLSFVKKHIKKLILSLLMLVFLLLFSVYSYYKSVTGMEVVAKEFEIAVNSNDYERVASLLSTDKIKWSKEQAHSFINYMNDQGIQIRSELDDIIQSNGKNIFNDKNGNKLFGLEESGTILLFFKEYHISTYPVELSISTNIDQLYVNDKRIEKSKMTSMGLFNFSTEKLKIVGNTKLGKLDTQIYTDLSQVENNQLKLNLSTSKKNLKVSLPKEISDASELKVIANGKEIATSLSTEIELIENQELEVYVTFKYDNNTYSTDKESINVSSKEKDIPIHLTVPGDILKNIDEGKKTKVAQAISGEKQEQLKRDISEFLHNYREAVFTSIELRTILYGLYYDLSSSAYKEMEDFTIKGGADKAKIDRYLSGKLDIQSITEKDGKYIVKTYEDFTSTYTDGRPPKQFRKNKTYSLRPSGGSFVIYDLVSEDI